MGFLVDVHVHTQNFSTCSHIEPKRLIPQAIKAGIDAVVITEHHYQWREEALAELVRHSPYPDFVVLAGFEYTSTQGDILIYGITARQAGGFARGMTPEQVMDLAHGLGGVCIGAHPTRAGLGFDEKIATLPFDALEIKSMNLKEHEQREAERLAARFGLRPVAASDAHVIQNVGVYAIELDRPVRTMADLQESLQRGTFRPVVNLGKRRV
jgi:hypothetical protein